MSNLKKNRRLSKTLLILYHQFTDTSGVILNKVDISKTSYKEKYDSLLYFVSKNKKR